MKKLSDLSKSINTALNNTSASITGSYLTVKDKINNKVDSLVTRSTKLIETATSLGTTLVQAGILVSAIAAPVPTFVAIALFYLMKDEADSSMKEMNKDIKYRKDKRKLDTAITILKKYGAIPKTAKVQTKYLKLNICSETNEVSGIILTGEFKDRKLSELSSGELIRLLDNSPDKETQELLEAYISFKDSVERKQ